MKRRMLAGILSSLLAVGCQPWKPAFDERVAADQHDRVAIAPLRDALTFARVQSDAGHTLLAVKRYDGGQIEAVDLTELLGGDVEDPITAFQQHGHDELERRIATAPESAQRTIAADRLTLPLALTDAHIAVGTNYPAHAADAGTVRPFLFPKLVRPTAYTAPVSAGDGILDYEVELAFVTLGALDAVQGSGPLGLILCNDYTDRATLMRAIDAYDIESGKGFTTGKSFPGYLPVGNLFVIPRDLTSFVDQLTLQLDVNDDLRQRAHANEMVWDIREILRQSWQIRETTWEYHGAAVSLPFTGDQIPARTLILSGTPHGTVFDGMPTRFKLAGVGRWLASGFDGPVTSHVMEAYITAAQEARAYLQPGDHVTIQAPHLGIIRNEIVR